MQRSRTIAVAGLAALLSAAAPEPIWHVGVTEAGAPFAAVYDEDERAPMLRFECTPDRLVATAFRTEEPLEQEAGDDGPKPVRVKLTTDKVDPGWVEGQAVRNAGGGRDLTTFLPFDHPAFLAFPRAEFIGLISKDGGSLSVVEKGDRKRLAEFVRQCRGG